MKYVFFSKLLARNITFSRPYIGYIHVKFTDIPDTIGMRIHNTDDTPVWYDGDNTATFKMLCVKWMRENIVKEEW